MQKLLEEVNYYKVRFFLSKMHLVEANLHKSMRELKNSSFFRDISAVTLALVDLLKGVRFYFKTS